MDPNPPTLLAFDTATEHLSVALGVRGAVFSRDLPRGAQASVALIPAILSVLAEAGVSLRDLDAIAFGRGPGAFTGLRTACSVAQGLAFGAGLPVLPIDTLLAVAEDARGGVAAPLAVWVAMDARMNEIYAARYAFAHERWRILDAPMLIGVDALNERWRSSPADLVAGNAVSAFGARLDVNAARVAPGASPRAASMLPLAAVAWAEGCAVDAALALPFYLRDKVAQTTLERDAARAAKELAGGPG